jgi:hypothetical protein
MMTAAAVTTIILFTVFITGVAAGVLGVITVAVHRTERNHALTLPAADAVTQTGRWFHGVYVCTPVSARAPVPGRQSVDPARRATDGPKEKSTTAIGEGPGVDRLAAASSVPITMFSMNSSRAASTGTATPCAAALRAAQARATLGTPLGGR